MTHWEAGDGRRQRTRGGGTWTAATATRSRCSTTTSPFPGIVLLSRQKRAAKGRRESQLPYKRKEKQKSVLGLEKIMAATGFEETFRSQNGRSGREFFLIWGRKSLSSGSRSSLGVTSPFSRHSWLRTRFTRKSSDAWSSPMNGTGGYSYNFFLVRADFFQHFWAFGGQVERGSAGSMNSGTPQKVVFSCHTFLLVTHSNRESS